jgi:hypothetical protein
LKSVLIELLLATVFVAQSAAPARSADPPKPAEAQQSPNTLTPAELAEGWILLFDGQSLHGWHPTTPAPWDVKDGAITVSGGEPGLLCTMSQFGDFQLQVDFRAPATTNSGIFLQTSKVPRDPVRDCYELNIHSAPDAKFPTGSFVGRKRVDGAAVDEGWHHYDVTARGGKFVVRLDGRQILEYEDPHPIARGHIGLQLNTGPVAFRNIKLKPLGLESIFNGQDLTGWKPLPGKPGKFEVEGGELKISGGPGQLESEGKYADFVLQLEAFVGAPRLNSGVFFRCIPGEYAMGYESQIHNGFLGGDRNRPQDCGTGGIYRRQNARRVVADDQTWFHKTIVSDGDHMAVWVNGILVTDFTDYRAADVNPRKGLRREAGTLQLQAHDPTTNLRFKNLRIAEKPPRKDQASGGP